MHYLARQVREDVPGRLSATMLAHNILSGSKGLAVAAVVGHYSLRDWKWPCALWAIGASPAPRALSPGGD